MTEIQKTLYKKEIILGLAPPDHAEKVIENIKIELYRSSGESNFRALPCFIPLASGPELTNCFNLEDRGLPDSPELKITALKNRNSHLYLSVQPEKGLHIFQKKLPISIPPLGSELVPLVNGVYLGPISANISSNMPVVPEIIIKRFKLMILTVSYNPTSPWDNIIHWEILLEKPLYRHKK